MNRSESAVFENQKQTRHLNGTLTHPGDMAVASHQGHSSHPLGKHCTSLHRFVACRSQGGMALDSWIQEDKSDRLDMELLKGHQWALAPGPQ